MKRIFDVNLYLADSPDGEVHANLILPATPYELLDALDKLRLENGELPHWKISRYRNTGCFRCNVQGTIYELNALAEKLSELNEVQTIAYDGLLSMEPDPVMVSRMIDLAHSTDCCHVITEARNDWALGRFYVESGLLPEMSGLSERQRALLDYEKIGREQRQAEGGVFVRRDYANTLGYVVQKQELKEVYKDLDLTLRQPDYSFLLHIARGYYAPPAADCEKAVQLQLPAEYEVLEGVLASLKVNDWQETVWYGLDCCVPALTDMIYSIGVNDAFTQDWMDRLNGLAQQLSDMDAQTLNTYKALLETADCKDIQSAELLADTLDNYILSTQFSSPSEVAKGELSLILPDQEVELIIPHLNLYQYGQALIEKCGGTLTGYGLIERRDGQPVLAAENPQWGGMEMR